MAKVQRDRVLLTPNPTSLAILGISHSATPISQTLNEYAALIERSTSELANLFTRNEWNYLADTLNGHLDFEDRPYMPVFLVAEVSDAHSLNGMGYKWFGDEKDEINRIEGKKNEAVEKKVSELVRKIESLSILQIRAVLIATRFFWDCSESVDHAEDEWWTVDYRKKNWKKDKDNQDD